MKKWITGGIVFIFLLLDYAALDDITTDKQSSYLLEYAFLLISLIVYFLTGIFLLRMRKNGIY